MSKTHAKRPSMAKRRMITFMRIIKNGLTSLVRNLWLAVAAIAVMTVTLGIVLVSVVASATFNHTIKQITDRINVSVYLKDSVTEEQRENFVADLRKQPNVKEVRYVSKSDALQSFSADRSNNPATLEALAETGNPLPASVQIYPVDPSNLDSLTKYLDKPELKELRDERSPISYSGTRKTAIDNITRATNVMRQIGAGAVIVFAVISMLIIFNTIQMAIFNRRDELTIMRLLGATTSYIRGPFVVESIMYGVVAALVSMALMYGVFVTASNTLQATSFGLLDIQYSSTYFNDNLWKLLGLQLAVGIVIGSVSSTIATRRYLKFKPAGRRGGLRLKRS